MGFSKHLLSELMVKIPSSKHPQAHCYYRLKSSDRQCYTTVKSACTGLIHTISTTRDYVILGRYFMSQACYSSENWGCQKQLVHRQNDKHHDSIWQVFNNYQKLLLGLSIKCQALYWILQTEIWLRHGSFPEGIQNLDLVDKHQWLIQ